MTITGCAKRSECNDDLQTSVEMNGESIGADFPDEVTEVSSSEAQITVPVNSENMAAGCPEEVP